LAIQKWYPLLLGKAGLVLRWIMTGNTTLMELLMSQIPGNNEMQGELVSTLPKPGTPKIYLMVTEEIRAV